MGTVGLPPRDAHCDVDVRNPSISLDRGKDTAESYDAANQIFEWREQITEARSLLEACGSFEAETAKVMLRAADDILTKSSEGLDSLTLEGIQRDQRRALLRDIESLGTSIS